MTRMRQIYWRRMVTCLAIGAILCEAFLTAVTIPASFALANTSSLPAAENTIVICTGSGMKRMTLGLDGELIEQPDQDEEPRSCPSCALTGFFALDPPETSTLGPAETQTSLLPVRALDLKVDQPRYVCPEGRAPPFDL